MEDRLIPTRQEEYFFLHPMLDALRRWNEMNKDKVGRIEFGPEKTMRETAFGFGAGKVDDEIEHPSHYTQGKIEVIDFLIDQDMNFMAANAVKYLCRYRFKGNPVQDLKKARWYLDRLIKEVEMAQPDPRCKTFGVLAEDLSGNIEVPEG